MNTIIALAIHDLERGGDGYDVKLATDLLPITTTTQRVVDDLNTLYNRRASKSHGKFAATEGYPTEGHLRAYLLEERRDFLGLTSKMMETLRRQAAARSASEGGHVFFAHFRKEDRDFVIVAIISDKLSAMLTSTRDVQDVKHLDIEGFRFAGRINLKGWAESEERYISFLKGKGNVSDYFKEFLGCDSAVLDRKDTTDLVVALKTFATEQKLEDSDAFLAHAKAICERASRAKEELEFESLANELLPKSPRLLVDFLAADERKLNDRFVPNLQALRALVKFKGKTALWSVEFDRSAITSNAVRFDAKANALTLYNVPLELVADLRADGVLDV